MKSSIRIQDGLSCMGTDEDAEEQRVGLQERILRELHQAILKAEKGYDGRPGSIIVHVCPRRFQMYGWLEVFTESAEGAYRLNLPVESRIVSDRNISQHCFSITIEQAV